MLTHQLLMIRPINFAFNTDTANDNHFQQTPTYATNAQAAALKEFDDFVEVLAAHDIDVLVINDTPVPYTPDSIFPNNWISFHEGGTICLYPMYAPNRRLERKLSVLNALKSRFTITKTLDFSHYENENVFLEGTGSMVFDRDARVAYACLSARTHQSLLEEWCQQMQYQPVFFNATDANQLPIYHTNVLMCIGETYAVICTESIIDIQEKANVINSLQQTGKTIVEISLTQMNCFAGNMLQVCSRNQQPYLVMSSQAYNSLTPHQMDTLKAHNPILHSPLTTIETNGGGSARCMMAEIFLSLQ